MTRILIRFIESQSDGSDYASLIADRIVWANGQIAVWNGEDLVGIFLSSEVKMVYKTERRNNGRS